MSRRGFGFAEHIRQRWLAYAIACLVFVIGTVSGAVTVKAITFHQKQDLIGYINTYFETMMVGKLEAATWQSVVWMNFQTVVLMWLCGLIVFGVPVIIGLIFARGFVIGFSVGFLVDELGLKGFLFALASIIPHNLIVVPALVGLGALGICFSFSVIFGGKHRVGLRKNTSPAVQYSANTVLFLLLMAAASLVEVFITPVFIKAALTLF
ncbi:MAG: stage II sporulation protein M [Bacillota bacterium]|nr:MAG: stage II sporulation protein M [Bacillota bacterium]MBS3950708.1 stage II sporulation protein M [Peptococcaceae bacterium]